MMELAIFVAITALLSVGVYKLFYLEISFFDLVKGTGLVGLLLAAVCGIKDTLEVKKGDAINAVLVCTLWSIFHSHYSSRSSDRSLLLIGSISTITINFVVYQASSKLFDVAFKLSLLVFNLKMECTAIEFAFQVFIMCFLLIQQSGIHSKAAYQTAFVQKYREAIEANSELRNLTMVALRNSISAIQVNNEYVDNLTPRSKTTVSSNPHLSQQTTISRNLSNMVELISFFDLASRHQFLELDSHCLVLDPASGKVKGNGSRLTHEVLNSDGMQCISTTAIFKQAVQAFRELICQNFCVASVFLNEAQHRIPTNIIVNRQILGALLNLALSLAIASNKTRGLSIYVTWKPKKCQINFDHLPESKMTTISPFYVISAEPRDDLCPIKVNEEELPNNANIRRQTAEFKGNVQDLDQSIGFSPILHNSQLQPFSFSSQRQMEDLRLSAIQKQDSASIQLMSMSELQKSDKNAHQKDGNSFGYNNLARSQSFLSQARILNGQGRKESQGSFERILDQLDSARNRNKDPSLPAQSNKNIKLNVRPSQFSSKRQGCESDHESQLQSVQDRSQFQQNPKEPNLSKVMEDSKENVASASSSKKRPAEGVSSFDDVSVGGKSSLGSKQAAIIENNPSLDFRQPSEMNNEQFLDVQNLQPLLRRSKSQIHSQSKANSSFSLIRNEDDRINNEGIDQELISHQRNQMQVQNQRQDLMRSLVDEDLDDPDLLEVADEICEVHQVFEHHEFQVPEDPLKQKRIQGKVRYIFPENEVLSLQEPLIKNSCDLLPAQLVQQEQVQLIQDVNANPNDVQEININLQQDPPQVLINVYPLEELPQQQNERRIVSEQGSLGGQINSALAIQPEGMRAGNRVSGHNLAISQNNKLQTGSSGESNENFSQSSDSIDLHNRSQLPPQRMVQQQPLSQFGNQVQNIEESKNSSDSNLRSQSQPLSVIPEERASQNRSDPSQYSELFDSGNRKISNQIERCIQSNQEQNKTEKKKSGEIAKQSSEQLRRIIKKSSFGNAEDQKQLIASSSSSGVEEEQKNAILEDKIILSKKANCSRISSLSNLVDEYEEEHKLLKSMNFVFKSIEKKQNPEIQQLSKIIEVRTPKRGRSKSIQIGPLNQKAKPKRISRLNNYTPALKQHRCSISLGSDLDSIEEEGSEGKKLSSNSAKGSARRSRPGEKQKPGQITKQLQEVAKQPAPASGQKSAFANYQFGKIVDAPSPLKPKFLDKAPKEVILKPKFKRNFFKQDRSKSICIVNSDTRKNSLGKPVLPIVIENYGHGRRSNLKKKVTQLVRDRAKSVVLANVDRPRIQQVLTEPQSLSLQVDQLNLLKDSGPWSNQEDREQQLKELCKQRGEPSFEDSDLSLIKAQRSQQRADLTKYQCYFVRTEPVKTANIMREQLRMIKQDLLLPDDKSNSNSASASGPSSGESIILRRDTAKLKQFKGKDEQLEQVQLHVQDKINVRKKSSILTIDQILSKPMPPQMNIVEPQKLIFTEDTSSSSIIQRKEPQKQLQPISQSNALGEKTESYFANLRSKVMNKEASSETNEIFDAIRAWGSKTYMPWPENSSADLFDGELQIQILDIKTCEQQISKPASTANLANVKCCKEHLCNRAKMRQIQTKNGPQESAFKTPLEYGQWMDLGEFDFGPEGSSEVKLCRYLAEILGAEVQINPKRDYLGNQFNITVPVISMTQNE